MKKLAILILFVSISFFTLHSGWEVQRQPSPHQIHFQGIDFVDSLHGWVVGGRVRLQPVFNCGSGLYWRRFWWGGRIGKTSDGGLTWSFTDIDSSRCFYDVEFLDTLNGWVVGNCRHGNNWYGLILKTTDGGSTWERDSFPLNQNEYFYSVDFVDTLNGWVFGEPLLYHTTDGDHWTLRYEYLYFTDPKLSFVSPTEGWIFQSIAAHTTDAGSTWAGQSAPWALIAGYMLDSMNGFAVGYQDTLLYTTRGGQPWEFRPMNTGSAPFYDVFFLDTLTGYACGEAGIVVKTTDGGVTWQKMWVGTNARLWSVDAVGDEVWACGEWTTLVHNEGSGWEFQLPWSNWLRGVEFLDSLEGWIAGTGGMVLHTLDGGTNWESKQLPLSDEFRDVAISDSVAIFAVGRVEKTDQPLMMRSLDAGSTWERVSIGGIPFIRAIDFLDSMSGWIAATNIGEVIVRGTLDGCNSWYSSARIDTDAIEVHDIVFVDRDQYGFPKVWLVDVVGLANAWGKIWHKRGGSGQWERQVEGPRLYGISMWDTLTGYCCGKDVVRYTHDGGNHWPFQEPTGFWLGIDCGDSNSVWAVGDSGRILRSDDGGLTWDYEESNVEATLERVDFVDTLNGWAVGEAGVILHYGAGVGIKEPLQETMTDNTKLIASPNPFTISTTISISRMANGAEGMELQIYDVSGRLVKSVEVATCTDHIGADLVPGIYFLKVKVGEHTETTKLIKIR